MSVPVLLSPTHIKPIFGHATDFIGKFFQVAPFATRRVQTDNGSEFARHFDDFCTEAVSCPTSSTIPGTGGLTASWKDLTELSSEQCVIFTSITWMSGRLQPKLMDYLIWYNTGETTPGYGSTTYALLSGKLLPPR